MRHHLTTVPLARLGQTGFRVLVSRSVYALGGLRLGRSMFYSQGEAPQAEQGAAGEGDQATVFEFGFDAVEQGAVEQGGARCLDGTHGDGEGTSAHVGELN